MNKQPVYAISKSRFLELLDKETISPDFSWGKAVSKENIVSLIEPYFIHTEYVKIHDVHKVFQELQTNKLIAYANCNINRILRECTQNRIDLKGVKTNE